MTSHSAPNSSSMFITENSFPWFFHASVYFQSSPTTVTSWLYSSGVCIGYLKVDLVVEYLLYNTKLLVGGGDLEVGLETKQ